MGRDSGLGIPTQLICFLTIWFSFLGEGSYLAKRPTFPRALGAPFWNHCPDFLAVITV